ncbi:MAG TPA: ABC transporter ATP-binding protein [Lachnospiraceae bacterium]|nr:ABC-F family ATP-binding cassette domain-containing protein [uncultured Lachnoclostridium sp.]HAU87146.1 ABC transporter ATP-binding protein [Lachnospiraceae bacterium]
MLYQIANGAVRFADKTVLEHINFEIRNTEKIAVVGRNGCGKTTLLKLIAGEIDLDKRDSDEDIFIAKAGNPEIAYLRQIAFDDSNLSMEKEIRKVFAPIEKMRDELEQRAKALEVNYSEKDVKTYTNMQEHFESIGGYFYEKEYEMLIQKFGFSEEDKKKPLNEFSGGQQTKIAFIKLLLSKPDILLLDEPTNHLDVETIEWLETYIKNYPKAVVVVSHDRMFLDKVADVVYEIEYHTAKRYPGNYTDFVVRKKENYEKQMKDYTLQQKEIKRLEMIVEKFKNKPTKVAMTRSKLKAIEHMDKVEKPDKYDSKTFHAHFQPEVVTGNDVLLVQDLQIGYDKPLSTVTIDIKKGDKIGILGGNGLGKSTFLKTIVEQIPALGGSFRYGTNVQIGYFDQQMAQYKSKKTVLDDFWDEFPELIQTEVRNMLGAFLFSGDDVFKTVDMLSGGEKVRLALCKIFKRRPNVLILDEPTNHMDIVGKETLESMLKEYGGTVIFVSHDRYFIKQVSNRLLFFEAGLTTEYQFGYEQYLEAQEKKRMEEEERERQRTFAKKSVQTEGVKKAKKYYNPGKEKSKLERKLKKIEERLEEKEAQLEHWKQELQKPENQSDYVKLGEIQEQIDTLEMEVLADMEEWEQVSSELEA